MSELFRKISRKYLFAGNFLCSFYKIIGIMEIGILFLG